MSGLTLNLDFAYNDEARFVGMRKEPAGNSKHQQFVRKRRFLECKGLLHDKQNLDVKRQGPRNPLNRGPQPWQNGMKRPFTPNPIPHKSPVPKPIPSQRQPNTPLSKSSTTPMSGSLKTSSKFTTLKKYSESIATSSQSSSTVAASHSLASGSTRPHILGGPPPFGNPLKYLALDCEMVGTGPKGQLSELARCSIVSYNGDIVYDKYIMPTRPVTDFRTRWSGIRRQHLCNATPFVQAKKEIVKILAGKVVVGHAIHNDFKSLSYSHPAGLTRDTSRIPLLNKKAGLPEMQPASLKRLTKALFNQDIQVGNKGHSSVEDAKATMELYKIVEVEWERTLAFKSGQIKR
ncbi:hypothetical protein AAFF_G00426750 [Aldrovandia affinis]|uniref:Exonuclease domain-containing protein n=1 Tax=Aldrovandia affinis TaxID=143900 RepID=A0AAD7S9G2_9TELE|nr:hypothetical protein AAFF_G00426750 [Aldrovandia affinis]